MADLSQNLKELHDFLMPNLMWQDITDGKDELMKRIKLSYIDADKAQYDQYDDPFGILAYRGLGGDPPVTTFGSFQKFEVDPGYWGAKTFIRENQITTGRQPGTLADPIKIADQSNFLCLNFSTQIVSLVRKSIADTIRTGMFVMQAGGNIGTVGGLASSNPQGGQTGQQFVYQIANYASQMLSPGTPWKSSNATATPITDMLGFKAGLIKASSNNFGRESILLCNSNTAVDLFNTAQIMQTYKGPYGSSILGLDGETADVTGLNKIQLTFDLPDISIYDYGWYNTLADAQARNKAAWNYIIPNQTLLWIGKRPESQLVGEFQLTRHAGLIEKGNAASYPNADDMLDGIEAINEGLYVRAHYQNRQPHQYEIECGLNGTPLIGYPGAVAVITYT